MASRIGADLHRARTRREIDISEVEAATRIRGRFLHAIENEEWEALPGGVYTRGFIRTYANFLSLDGDRLAEDYRREVEGWRPEPAPSIAPSPAPRESRGVPWLAAVAVGAVGLTGVVAIFLIPGGGDEGAQTGAPVVDEPPAEKRATTTTPSHAAPAGVSMRLTADAEVWACVLDADDRPLVDGRILEAGTVAGPFRSDSFTLSFGNGEVTMAIDGKEAQIPPSASPVGYVVDPAGTLTELSEAERPTCE